MSIPNRIGRFAIKSGRVQKRGRYVFYGPGSIGKTTLACSAPQCLVKSMEDGDREFDVARYVYDEAADRTHPLTFDEVINGLADLQEAPNLGTLETLIVDGTHQLDALAQAKVCKVNGWKSIAEPGFEKGEKEVLVLMRQVFARLDDLNSRRNMRIILTGHDRVANFKDPNGVEYGHYDLAVTKSRNADVAGFIYGWSDVFGFCRFTTETTEVGKKEKARTISLAEEGRRQLHLRRTTAHVAKCRWGGPAVAEMTREDGAPVTWADLFAELESKSPDVIRKQIATLLESVPPDTADKVRAWLATVPPDDVAALSRGLEGLKKQQQQNTTTNTNTEAA